MDYLFLKYHVPLPLALVKRVFPFLYIIIVILL